MQSIKLGNTLSFFAALLALLSLNACSEFDVKNLPPVATVRVMMNGAPVNIEEPIPYMGTPLALTLDGTLSTDEDGNVAKYTWYRTDLPPNVRYDAGVMDIPTEGDLMPVAAPQVMLGEGSYQYSLWVTDDEDMISEPATVEFTIKTPTNYMPDATCAAMYMSAIPECVDCVCTPTASMGCLDNFAACYQNPDPMFVTLCKAIVDCAREKGCVGAGCFMPALCQAEITAGVTYMGGTDCMGDPAVNPCAAASAIGTCTSMGTCMAACN
jgi:hypothetical protein